MLRMETSSHRRCEPRRRIARAFEDRGRRM